MRNFDLTTGMAKLGLAMRSLQTAGLEAEQYWSDAAHRKFQETYIVPLEPAARNLLDAVHRLAEILASAERQCGMD